MEATGTHGGWGLSLSYQRHEETGSTSSYTSSSSRSGTIVSTAYTSSSSRLSSTISAEAALLQLELQTDKKDAEFVQPIKKPRIETKEMLEEKKKIKHMQSLVQEFFRAPVAKNRGIVGGDMNVLERWFTELGVGWVLHLTDFASTWELGHPTRDDMLRWIRALTEIVETISATTSFFPDHGHGFVGMPGISEEELPPESGKEATSLDPLQFALFFQETVSRMLVFVDVMFSKSIVPCNSNSLLVSCLDVYGALSKELSRIRLQQSHSPLSAEVEKIEKEMVSLLSAKQGKAFEAIWSILQEIRIHALKSMEEYSLGTQTPQGSSDIHKATYLVMDHIKILLRNESTVTPLVSQAVILGKYVPQTGFGEAPPFISLITEMVSCLEEKLITKSQLFLDQGLRFLFLLNNSNFIRELLKDSLFYINYIKVDVEIIPRKLDELGHYIESYIQVSWAPMLSCLSNHTPLCLGRNHSPSPHCPSSSLNF